MFGRLKIPRTLVLSKPCLPLYLRFARLGGLEGYDTAG